MVSSFHLTRSARLLLAHQNNAQSGAESTLTAILGRMATDVRHEVTWDEMMKSA
jgi:hypothetical protein